MEKKNRKIELERQVGTSVPTYPERWNLEVGTRIKEVANLFPTREIAAKVAGIDSETLNRWFKGTNKPSFLGVAKLCLATGRSLDWLAIGEDMDRPHQAVQIETREQSADYIANGVDQATLARAIEAMEEALALAGKEVGIERKAGIVAAVYGALARPGGAADHAEIMRLIRSMLG